MKKTSGPRQRACSVTIPLALILTLLVAVAATRSIRAQCTRSCGGPPPVGFVLLHNFTGPPDGLNSPAGLVEDAAGNLYGTTTQGGGIGGACGNLGCGTVFKVDKDGNETVLHRFDGQPDGASPLAGLFLDAAGNMYGTTSLGGTSNLGTVFKLDSTGKESVLYSFTGEPDGADPVADLVLDATGNIYGTTSLGGSSNLGTVFKLDSASKESVLYSFEGEPDGAHPVAGLIMDATGNLYGTTFEGGAAVCRRNTHYKYRTPSTCGVVFKLDSSGAETVLYSFTGDPDGANPAGDLVRDSTGNFYGTTLAGGILCYVIAPGFPGPPSYGSYCGTVFQLDATGKENVLHSFSGTPDGAIPHAGLILDAAGNLYGTTSEGGAGGCWITSGIFSTINLGCGSVFALDTTGNATVLYSFSGTGLDWGPQAKLALDPGGDLFGTTTEGGVIGGECANFGCGVVFKLGADIVPPDADSPTFSPPSGTYNSIQSVTISDSTLDSTIYYTTDGSAPTTSSLRYGGGIAVNGSETIKAIAVAPGFSNSSIASADFTINTPDFSLTPAFANLTVPPGGQRTEVITITPQNGPFGNPIQLTCGVAGPSPTPTCSLASASVTLGAKAATSTLMITVPANSAMQTPSQLLQRSGVAHAAWLPFAFGLLVIAAAQKRRRDCWALGGSLLLLLLLQSACGGGSTTSQENYTVTVTGTSGAIQHVTQVGVTVQ